jgi:flagellar hook-basal body complex protein FliE
MIGPVGPQLIPNLPGVAPGQPASTGLNGFGAVMEAAVRRVEASQADAAGQIQRFIAGDSEDIHTTALAIQKSELEFEMFLQVRNKVVQAYQEIMRTQV